ncbi:Methyl sulfide methyltransferase-associated sensor [Saliniradius amylolyticus]|uniref:Methyl sulfide methyltransferase-associated sensor n=1 Tax=Saliniradius amylolyticus TaxID=2183582 RepID=A0A2S2E6U3_9ALTE|nr:diguanylate cyclase [Saliniradius amylolyticus]AWL13355.1 Methyl sulfide methyltransferase-associated sensor [Saliniradius amylolyticus]
MDAQFCKQILDAQQQALEAIAFNQALPNTLNDLCRLIESLLPVPSARASILLLDGDRLRTGGAPSLPKAYCDAIDGAQIGPAAGSCGTACYRRQPVFVKDIVSDPLWRDYRHIALQFGLRSCWSMPILSSSEHVLGSFAVYYDDIRGPDDSQLELIQRFNAIASVAIERSQTSRREQQLLAHIQEANNRFHAFSQVMTEIAFVFDKQGHCVDVFGNIDKIYEGADPNTVIGQKLSDVLPDELSKPILSVIERTISSGLPQHLEYTLPTRDGLKHFEGRAAPINAYLKEDPDRPHVVWMAIDITNQTDIKKEIQRLAYHDELSQLPNRRLLLDRLTQAMRKARRLKKYCGLLYLDVDDFKPINDIFGHSAGDSFLQQLAERLTAIVRETDTIARMGGDEFIILLDTYHSQRGTMQNIAQEVANKVVDCFSRPFLLGDQPYTVSTSIGVSLFNHQTPDHEAILRHADQAMYLSKQKHGNCISFYDPSG